MKLRIIAGLYKGKHLYCTSENECRPTKDRIKESLFSSLQGVCQHAICLDICAGNGSLGFEALSRGAAHIDFVDINTQFVKKNRQLFADTLPCAIYQQDAVAYLKQCQRQYDLIFIDPPWAKQMLYYSILEHIMAFNILKADGIILCEHNSSLALPSGYRVEKEKQFKKIKVSFIRRVS